LKIECKECGAEMSAPDDVVVGEILTCPECGADFEIASKTAESIELKSAESIGEDWGQ
jgi:alpha-aminoadipate carrier protein LysW